MSRAGLPDKEKDERDISKLIKGITKKLGVKDGEEFAKDSFQFY